MEQLVGQVAHEVGLQPRQVHLAAQDPDEDHAGRRDPERREAEDRPVEALARPGRARRGARRAQGDDHVEARVEVGPLEREAGRRSRPGAGVPAIDHAHGPERGGHGGRLEEEGDRAAVEAREEGLGGRTRFRGGEGGQGDHLPAARQGEHARLPAVRRGVLGEREGERPHLVERRPRAVEVGQGLRERAATRLRRDAREPLADERELGLRRGGAAEVHRRGLPGEEHGVRDGLGRRVGRGGGVDRQLHREPDGGGVPGAVRVEGVGLNEAPAGRGRGGVGGRERRDRLLRAVPGHAVRELLLRCRDVGRDVEQHAPRGADPPVRVHAVEVAERAVPQVPREVAEPAGVAGDPGGLLHRAEHALARLVEDLPRLRERAGLGLLAGEPGALLPVATDRPQPQDGDDDHLEQDHEDDDGRRLAARGEPA
jgi:hypothetical protein